MNEEKRKTKQNSKAFIGMMLAVWDHGGEIIITKPNMKKNHKMFLPWNAREKKKKKKSQLSNEQVPEGLCKSISQRFRYGVWHTGNCINVAELPQAEQI